MPDQWPVVRSAKIALVAAAAAGYWIASYLVLVAPPPAGIGTVIFAVLPMFVVIVAVGWRTHRVVAIVACAAAAALLWREAGTIGRHLPLVYLLQGVSADGALMILFAASLRAGHEPLCSRVAAMVRGRPLAPAIARYTRRVTIAWALFFAAMIVASITLFVAAPVDVWSAFANLLAWPLVALMFVAEYIVRRRVLRDVPHTPLIATLRAWSSTGRPSERATAPPR
jgi:uncharacterized membrane protein